jgi:hypothetical protein
LIRRKDDEFRSRSVIGFIVRSIFLGRMSREGLMARAVAKRGPVGIVARDAKGNQVAAHTAVFNAFGNVSMVSAGGGIATLEFTNGNNEALLVQLCINVTTASG